MIRSVKLLFCDNDHGCGDVTFPCIADLDSQAFVEPKTVGQLRKEARKAGWSHKNGADYCEICTEGEKQK
jgi:hypothetical protein